MGFASRLGCVVALGLFAAAACGGSVNSKAALGDEAPASASDFPARVAQVICDEVERCCGAAQLPFDRAAVCKDIPVDQVRTDSGFAYDRAAAQRCIDGFRRIAQDCSHFLSPQAPDCDVVTVPTLPLGASCTYGSCAWSPGQRTTCETGQNSITGTCVLQDSPPRGVVGDSCKATCDRSGDCIGVGVPVPASTPPPSDCYASDGLYCDGNPSQCRAMGNQGDTCWRSDGCAVGLACLGLFQTASSTTGVCGPPLPDGAPCGGEHDLCASYYCSPSTELCTRVSLSARACLGIPPMGSQ